MFLELSEAFVCPRCRPGQGLIVLVDRIDGRRVIGGRLGCPECDLRVPVVDEVVRFDELRAADAAGPPADATDEGAVAAGDAGATTPDDLPDLLAGVGAEEAATRLAALLGADDTSGYLLLGRGLARFAPGVARRAPEAEVLALADEPPASAPGVTWVVGAGTAALPLFTARLAASALAASALDEASEAVRVVRVGGLVVLLAPDPDVEEALEGWPVSEVAREADVVVLRREEGGFEEPFARFRGGPRPRRGDR